MKTGIFLFLVAILAVPIVALAGGKVHICHRDQGHPEWKEIEIAESALSAHLSHQWGADIYPVPVGLPVGHSDEHANRYSDCNLGADGHCNPDRDACSGDAYRGAN